MTRILPRPTGDQEMQGLEVGIGYFRRGTAEDPSQLLFRGLTVTRPSAGKEETEVEARPSKAKSAQKPIQDFSMEESFEEFIIAIIGEDKIPPSTLGTRIIEYQKRNEWDESGKKGLLKRFDIPANLTYKDALEKYLPNTVEIFEIPGSPPKFEFALKRGDKKQERKPVEKSDDKGIEEGVAVLLRLIHEGASNSATLGSRVVDLQKSEDWPETGRSAFNKRFGIPENQHYVTTIKEKLSGRIRIYQDPALGHNYCFELV